MKYISDMNPQLYLCASVFSTRGDSERVSRVLRAIRSDHDDDKIAILKLISVLWPEMDDPMKLAFVWDASESNGTDDENDLLISLIQEDTLLTAIVEMDIDTITIRMNTVSSFIEEKLGKFGLEFGSDSMMEDFLRARTLVVNSVNKDALCTVDLLQQSHKDSLKSWIEGTLKPLAHLNRRLDPGSKLSIYELESLSIQDVVATMWDLPVKEPSVVRSMMLYELKPYLEERKTYEPFYQVIFNEANFPLDTFDNFQIFKFLSNNPLIDDTKFKTTKWEIIYNHCINLRNIPLPNMLFELESIIKSFGDDSQIYSGMSLKQWLINIRFMNAMDIKDLKSLKQLKNEDSLAQASYFSMIAQNMFQGRIGIETVQSILEFIDSSILFDKLSVDVQTSIVLETLLKHGNFDVLEQFASSSGIKIADRVIIQHFWRFFNAASSASRSDINLKNAGRTLNLLNDKNANSNLFDILALVNRLSHYSLSFKRGVPFRPVHLLEFKSNPMEIIEKLLDLNPKLRKDIDTTFALLQEIYGVLKIKPSDDNFTKEFSKLLAEHINNSLANGDFNFAFDQALKLVDRPGASDHWVTIFQVGKYIDPNWIDGETPTEIIYLQLGILSKLLHVCPEKEYEVIVSQWSSLELELSTRNLISDKYSLENYQRSNDNFMNDVSTNVGNFLSGKFQWNLGSS